MKIFIVASVALFLTSCTTGSSGFNSVRNVEETNLRGQTIDTVMEMLGSPYAYYAEKGGQEQILVYDTFVYTGEPSLLSCMLLGGLGGVGPGNCGTKGGYSLQHCVSLHFGPDKKLIDIKRPIFTSGLCSEKSVDRFLPATRLPLEAIQDFKLDDGVNVLSEEELLILFIGNTAFNSMYSEYYEPPSGDKNEGQLRGNHYAYGAYSGNWSVKGQQICWGFDKLPKSTFGACYTVTKHGDSFKQFDADGFENFPYGGRVKLTQGNPQGL